MFLGEATNETFGKPVPPCFYQTFSLCSLSPLAIALTPDTHTFFPSQIGGSGFSNRLKRQSVYISLVKSLCHPRLMYFRPAQLANTTPLSATFTRFLTHAVLVPLSSFASTHLHFKHDADSNELQSQLSPGFGQPGGCWKIETSRVSRTLGV